MTHDFLGICIGLQSIDCIRVLQQNRTNRVDKYRYVGGDLLWELAHIIMKAEKSQDNALCKLENQESQWCYSIQTQRPETQSSQLCNSQLRPQA